jgi:RecB family exonuclease
MTRLLLQHPYPSVLLSTVAEHFAPDMALIVPNVQAGRDLRGALRQAGQARTLTQVGREALREAGWQPLRPGQREAFLRDALADVAFAYLQPLMHRPGTLARLEGLIGELMRANLEPQAVLAVAEGDREQDVALAFAALVERCQAGQVYPGTGTEYFAARLSGLVTRRGVMHGFAYLDAAQLALVNRLLAPGSVVTLPVSEVARSQRRTQETAVTLRSMGFANVPVGGAARRTGDQVVEAYLDNSSASRGLRQEAYPDVDSEVRACLRQVRAWLEDGAQPEQMAIIVRREATYLSALSDVAGEFQLPLVSGAQMPLLETPLGAVVQAWVDAHAREWRYLAARRLLTHPLLRPPFDPLSRARALQPKCPSGAGAWDASLAWLELPEETSWQSGLGVLQRLLVELGVAARCAGDPPLNAALTLLTDRLEAEARRPDSCSREDLLGMVAHVLRSSTVPVLLGRSGVRVANPIAALGRRFDHVWVLGVADTLFPSRAVDNPLLDAFARARWASAGVILPDASGLASVEEALFLGAVGGAGLDVVVSRPRRDEAGKDVRPSLFWRRLGGEEGQNVPMPYGSLEERRLALTLTGAPPEEKLGAVEIERSRDAGQIGVHNGTLSAPILVVDRRWSPSQLHSAGDCRFKWFAEKLLGLQEPLDPEAQEDRRITGTLLHAALEGALKDGAVNDAPALRVQRAERALLSKEREMRGRGEFYAGPLWPVQLEEIRRTAGRAVRSDDFLPPGWTPVALEKKSEFTVTAGVHTYQLMGVVDRLDRTPDGLTVTDYKTGSYVSKVVLDGKRNLEVQLPLYMKALDAVNGRYFGIEGAQNLKEGAGPLAESPRKKYRWEQHQQDVMAFLEDLGDHLLQGDVSPSPDTAFEACTYCRMRPVCRHRGVTAEGAEVSA